VSDTGHIEELQSGSSASFFWQVPHPLSPDWILQPQVVELWHLQQTLNVQSFEQPPVHASAYALFDLRLPNIITAEKRRTASFR
jgi:hypothetical protein